MIILLIVGVVLLIVGYMVPMPPPLSIACRVGGAICLAIALILLVMALLSGTLAIGGTHIGAAALYQ